MPCFRPGGSCAGLLCHVALDDERFWFRDLVAADAAVIASVGTQDDAWQVPPDVRPDDVRRCIDANASWPTRCWTRLGPTYHMPEWRAETVHAIVLYVITETTCHAGHLDAAREVLDGRQWLVLPC